MRKREAAAEVAAQEEGGDCQLALFNEQEAQSAPVLVPVTPAEQQAQWQELADWQASLERRQHQLDEQQARQAQEGLRLASKYRQPEKRVRRGPLWGEEASMQLAEPALPLLLPPPAPAPATEASVSQPIIICAPQAAAARAAAPAAAPAADQSIVCAPHAVSALPAIRALRAIDL